MPEWKQSLKQAAITPTQLIEQLKLDTRLLPGAITADQLFQLKVPQHFLDKIDFNNPNDPLLLQILPRAEEALEVAGYTKDALQEQNANPVPGLLHKYQGRVLFITSTTCAINCRYCFRRHFPYQDNNPGKAGWQKVLDYIKQDTSIEEVILSGGDPLTLPDASLLFLIEQLNQIPHLTTLRFHTRVPVVMPERITDGLLAVLDKTRLKRVMVIHSNHANEIDTSVIQALNRLTQHGFTLLNQAVLLKDINDTPEALIHLSKTLFNAGVLPYYLHLLDKVKGTAHFDVDLEQAKLLMQEIAKKLPGYLVPKLVQEQPGMPYKTKR